MLDSVSPHERALDGSPRILPVRPIVAASSLLVFLSCPISGAAVAQSATKTVPVTGRSLVNLKAPHGLDITYSGAPDVVGKLVGGKANPTALATADFNADGAPDVVAGYSTAGGGVLTMLRGNPDAFAPKNTSLFMKAMHGDVPATFLPTAEAYLLPERPDLIVTGDFNRDGNRDVLVAARGGRLYLLAGDGTGKLGAPKLVSLGGRVRAMAATGDGHVAVSIDGAHGPELLILAPGPEGFVSEAAYPLPARGDAVLWGDLGGGADVAVGAGSYIAIFYSPLKVSPQSETPQTETLQTETIDLPFNVAGLTAGNFIWDREGRTEIAALAGDGTIHILQHGTLDTRPLTPADIPGRRAALREKRRQQRLNPMTLGAWTVAKAVLNPGSAPGGSLSQTAFSSPHLATAATNDLMVLDAEGNQLHILDTSGKAASPSASVSFSGAPVAALALPQKIDAHRETIVLVKGASRPIAFDQGPDPTYNVTITADVDSVSACATNSTVTTSSPPLSLREAICEANNSGSGTYTINVPAGTYQLNISTYAGNGTDSSSGLSATAAGELQSGTKSGTNITIAGLGQTPADTIIEQKDGVDRVIEQDPLGNGDMPLTIQNVTLTGGLCTTGLDCGFSGGAILAGGYTGDALMLTSVVVSGNSEQADTPALGGGNQGGGVSMAGPDLGVTNSTFSSNSVTASSTNSGVGGGVEFLDDVIGSLTVTDSTFIGNTVAASSNGAPGGGLSIDLNTIGDIATISGSTFTGNSAGGSNGEGGAIYSIGLTTVTNSRITGNTAAGGGSGFWEQGYANQPADGVGTVKNNWWGCNAGPGASGCDTVDASPISGDDASVIYSPYLELSISANPTTIDVNGTSTLTADLTHNSNGVGGFSVPNGTPISFGATDGETIPDNSITLSSGEATTIFYPDTAGTASLTATVDNETVSLNIDIVEPPSITSASGTTFKVGSNSTFDVTANGSPAPTFSNTGSLPSGVTFSSAGVLSGTPAAGTGGTYSLTITASNGNLPNDTQSFTLTVDQAPAITTGSSTTFEAGTAGSFIVATAAGTFPNATFSETGPLPTGVSFSNTGVLSGTPAAFTGGTYVIFITASNGVSPNATQTFVLTVDGAPSLNSASSSTFTIGVAGSFSVTASGFPTPSFSESGTLPSGITLSSAGLLSGTPAAGTGGIYPLTITASNGVSPDATQSFTLTIVPDNILWIGSPGGTTSAFLTTGADYSSNTEGGAGVAIDSSGNVWSLYAGGDSIAEFSSNGTLTINSPISGNALTAGASLAIDGSNQVWITNSTGGTIAVFNSSGTPVSTTAYTVGTSDPTCIAIDISGNVWIANSGGNSVTKILGAAAPTMPLAAGVAIGTPATQP